MRVEWEREIPKSEHAVARCTAGLESGTISGDDDAGHPAEESSVAAWRVDDRVPGTIMHSQASYTLCDILRTTIKSLWVPTAIQGDDSAVGVHAGAKATMDLSHVQIPSHVALAEQRCKDTVSRERVLMRCMWSR